ncbi:MAG TPA: ABC transporter permease [Candidatus Binataceae bacterium]|nr:ABC transporter permease [Candidatus Binataceae bacterium]
MFNWLKLIERNMRRNLRRTILTTATIALATFVFTVLVSVPASMDHVMQDASGTLRLIINNQTAPWGGIPARYCDDIRKMPGAAACVALTGWFATWRDPSEPVFAFAAGPEVGDVFPDYKLTGENRAATAREKRAAVVGRLLMRKYGWQVGQQITLRSTDSDQMEMPFVIIGVVDPKRYPNTFLFRRDYLMESRKANGWGDDDNAWNIIVRATNAQSLGPLAKMIDEHFKNSSYETRTMTESDAVAAGLSAVGNIRQIVLALCVVVLLTVLLIAANSTMMTVREQITSVAVMRALGFSRGRVATLLFGECAAIGITGGIVGAGAALWLFAGGVTLGAALGGNGALWVTPEQAVEALVVALAVSVLSGVVPIVEAVRVAPALAFRKVV